MSRSRTHGESGAITILVALMLLVLLTIAAVGMSKNSFREVVISGTTRQGAMVRNAADAGIEWTLYWMDSANAGSVTNTGVNLRTLQATLLASDSLSGQPYDVVTQAPYTGPPAVSGIPADQQIPAPAANTEGFTISLIRMGKLPITDMSQGTAQGTYTPAQGGVAKQAPNLWSVRSDSQLQVGGGVFAPTFIHAKEAWITTPVAQ